MTLMLGLVACGSDQGLKDESSPPAADPEPIDPPAASTPTSSSEPDEPEEPYVYVPPEPVPVTPPLVPCPIELDPDALASCTSAEIRAVHAGVAHLEIQDAIDAASPGDTVFVCPGTWRARIEASEITLQAADPTPGATVLSGVGNAPIGRVDNTNLVGLTLLGSSEDLDNDVGVIDAHGDSSLSCVVAEGNETVVTAHGPLTIAASVFAFNEGLFYGAVRAEADVVVEDTLFLENVAIANGGLSGSGALTVRRSEFVGNRALQGDGGAIAFAGLAGPLTIEDSQFRENRAFLRGGALVLFALAVPASITGSSFEGNLSSESGAIQVYNDFPGPILLDLTIADTRFFANDATVGPAVGQSGVTFGSSGGLGVYRDDDDPGGVVTLLRTTFEDNVALSGGAFGQMNHGFPSANTTALSFVGTDLVVHRNQGDAVWFDSMGTLECTDCDFGDGVDDNAPNDAVKDGVATTSLSSTFSL